ncbi:hypothetical protein KIN20_013626 [Parelaphostrongylus tenuis]|uniref:Uncharacterized protein n=1 Tax=Parelaphostrongylus tenuis TaxID=148309 RepID=A0AAD5QR61_PARTN|nr:hypothetical protein KIN20_013626 [Parelaphostrongylus tenuis]
MAVSESMHSSIFDMRMKLLISAALEIARISADLKIGRIRAHLKIDRLLHSRSRLCEQWGYQMLTKGRLDDDYNYDDLNRKNE